MNCLKPGELRALEAADSPQAWNRAVDAIREARGGFMPPDWAARVMDSGLFSRTRARWPKFNRMNRLPRTGRFDGEERQGTV